MLQLSWFVIRILALVERSQDVSIRSELTRIADDLAAECRRVPEEIQKQIRSH